TSAWEISAIARDLGAFLNDYIKPKSRGGYKQKYLKPYVRAKNTYTYQKGAGNLVIKRFIKQAGEQAIYGKDLAFPLKTIFLRVKIRSDIPIKTKAILWSGYDIKDLS
ncbi:MAG TPA: hypothetical protein VNJ29_02930, partial [Candidatus Nitrosotenuis sp.]|nr:hypothetical protein [Candidatus Nitrosotenuis sp.]